MNEFPKEHILQAKDHTQKEDIKFEARNFNNYYICVKANLAGTVHCLLCVRGCCESAELKS